MNRTDARTAEKLRNLRDGYGNGIAVYYGSPYIDRTPVLNNVLRDQVWFYYRAACVSDMEQRMRLSKGLRQKGVDLSRIPSYAEIFEKIFSDIPSGEQLIIILDRFEYFFYGEGSFLRSLVNAVETAPSAGRAFILLCSDDDVWVENSFVKEAGTYATRISGFVKKRENTFGELSEAFGELSLNERIAVYSLFGGETSLWKYYDAKKSVKENICRLFLDESAPLKGLAIDRVRDLVREPAVYLTILANLAARREKLNDLYHATGIPRAKLSVYLKTLMAPGFVEKVFSYGTVGTAQTKKGVYRIINPLIRFYFSAIYPNESMLFGMKPEKFYDMYVQQALENVMSDVFRLVCTEYVDRMDEQGRLPFAIAEEGEWNGKAGTIDIVAESETGDTLIGICSYRNILTEDDYHFALKYAKQAGLSVDHCYLFSGQGFGNGLISAAGNVTGLHLIGPKELDRG